MEPSKLRHVESVNDPPRLGKDLAEFWPKLILRAPKVRSVGQLSRGLQPVSRQQHQGTNYELSTIDRPNPTRSMQLSRSKAEIFSSFLADENSIAPHFGASDVNFPFHTNTQNSEQSSLSATANTIPQQGIMMGSWEDYLDFDLISDVPHHEVKIYHPRTPELDAPRPQLIIPATTPIQVGQTFFEPRDLHFNHFEKLPGKIVDEISSYLDLGWKGKMPACIVAFRLLPKMYTRIIGTFHQDNIYTLHVSNNWRFKNMTKAAVSTVKKLRISICTCHLTDGKSDTWFLPSDLRPEKSGAHNVEEVALVPFISPAPGFAAHECANKDGILEEHERWINKFPYFLTPFKALTSVQVGIGLVPWYHQNRGQAGKDMAKEITEWVDKELGVSHRVEESPVGPQMTVLYWDVKGEGDGEEKKVMDWSEVANKVTDAFSKDFGDLFDWPDTDEE
ncbi:hypothetical protein G7Y89_g12991 [Cudoniella acicularis]|uniref:Uncharacterized protein n=1 Tax=Cudoniella acicularis TaxID=354080 RepID=A0A8H4RAH1_9HELO|nr:hypothetical protein G7Y89_g12991 [Cudoniella acicularis]